MLKKNLPRLIFFLGVILFNPGMIFSEVPLNEVFESTGTKVIVREHPKTGESYVSIIAEGEVMRQDLLSLSDVAYSRPDYSMLESSVKPGSYEYEGPYSSRKKVYLLAAGLATLGVAGYAALPVAASTGAAGTGFGVGTTAALTSTGVITAAMVNKTSDLPDDYVRASESELLETESDFYQLHIKPEKL